MHYQTNYQNFSSIFAVPRQVVEQHLKLCGALALKALLLILSEEGGMDSGALARRLSVGEGDIKDAVNYWVQAGILSSADEAAAQPEPPAPAKEAPAAPQEETPQKVVRSGIQRPRLTAVQIAEMAKADSAVSPLLEELQTVLGRPLSPVEMECAVSLYSYYGLSPDYILIAANYCACAGKSSMRYLEKTISGWLEEGVDTYEKAEARIRDLTRQNENEKLIKSAFGIRGRDLTAREKQLADKWLDEFHQGIPLIYAAFEKTVEATGRISFAYLDKILTSWHEKGFTTPQQAKSSPAPRRGAAVENSSIDLGRLEERANQIYEKK